MASKTQRLFERQDNILSRLEDSDYLYSHEREPMDHQTHCHGQSCLNSLLPSDDQLMRGPVAKALGRVTPKEGLCSCVVWFERRESGARQGTSEYSLQSPPLPERDQSPRHSLWLARKLQTEGGPTHLPSGC